MTSKVTPSDSNKNLQRTPSEKDKATLTIKMTKAMYLRKENIATQKQMRYLLKQSYFTSLLETVDIKLFKAGRQLVGNQISDNKCYETFITVTDINPDTQGDRLEYLKRILKNVQYYYDELDDDLESMYSIARKDKMKHSMLLCCQKNLIDEEEEFYRFHISEKSYVFQSCSKTHKTHKNLTVNERKRELELALLNLRDGAGATVLHIAYLYGQYEIAHWLLETYPELCKLKYEMVVGGEEDPRMWPYLGK